MTSWKVSNSHWAFGGWWGSYQQLDVGGEVAPKNKAVIRTEEI
jgi:hypothetical protein